MQEAIPENNNNIYFHYHEHEFCKLKVKHSQYKEMFDLLKLIRETQMFEDDQSKLAMNEIQNILTLSLITKV